MILLDVNILVLAHRPDIESKHPVGPFLDELVNGDEPFGVPEHAMQSMVRICTSLPDPSPVSLALDFCDALRAAPSCQVIWPSERHWRIFAGLCRRLKLRGKIVAAAYLAAFALDRDDEWVTTDRDFAVFPGLRWRHPWERQPRTNPR